MMKSKLDAVYGRLLVNHFFQRGWGNPDHLQRLFEFRKIVSKRDICYPLLPKDYSIKIKSKTNLFGCTILEGSFLTPFELYLPGIVPEASRRANFEMILPNKWKDQKYKPMCIHLAGTGDHYYWRRRNLMAWPLARDANIGSIILENPYYGMRKPPDQKRSNLHYVSDIVVMGGCVIFECLVLLRFCEQHGFGPLGISGLSMGGHMASLAASGWPKPLALIPCLSGSTASTVFTSGVLSQCIDWDVLEAQYNSDHSYHERLAKMVTAIDDPPFMFDSNDFIKESLAAIDSGDNSSIIIEGEMQNQDSVRMPQSLSASCTAVSSQQESTSRLDKFLSKLLPKMNKMRTSKFDLFKRNRREQDSLQFMRGMMDDCTHLGNFTMPYDTSLIIAVCAKQDAYIPREGCPNIEDVWPGAEVRYVDGGHVTAYILYNRFFRACIIEAFERAKKVYDSNDIIIEEDLEPLVTYDQLMKRYSKSR